jgi:hypothetical protein
MVLIEIPKDEKIEDMLDALVEHLEELKQETSEIRKQGIDTTMVDLMMMDVLPKVKLARATYEQKDVDAVKKMLAQIRHEIDLAKTGTEFDDALKKIQDAYDKIREEKYADAQQIYLELREVYTKLSGEMRRIVYKASLDIHNRIRNAEQA